MDHKSRYVAVLYRCQRCWCRCGW